LQIVSLATIKKNCSVEVDEIRIRIRNLQSLIHIIHMVKMRLKSIARMIRLWNYKKKKSFLF
jgi:hypothetical protein